VRDYGVSPDRLLVAHPGAPDPFFDVPRGKNGHRPRILFVGGDFERKGGPALLQAFVPLASKAELVLVTGAAVPEQAGVTVLRDIRPGTAEQLRVFADADVFCLPTLGDCTSVALGEAMAAGLPVVTTTIASNPEWVPEDVGALISPNDDVALRAALERLVENASLRQSMGARARDWAEQHMRARRNAGRILRFMEEVA
jgi:glycosyltransferase involved in cell wall biosynthesis